ncbi:SAC7 [[Candida] subhashii]|uniref:SAC7 n=1 Tax=[Candida] subhashii TaxID=561895 RepID=A0A8J5QQ54_9ASCO|nr:SAC7 [[Candida] subhashii]KAG7664403.1 SAC7 [[Candida] subhashii]
MSHSSSPNNRGSIFGWAKSLKRGHLTSNDSLNEISDDDLSRSPTKSLTFQQLNQRATSPQRQHAQLQTLPTTNQPAGQTQPQQISSQERQQPTHHPMHFSHSQQSSTPGFAASPPNTNSATDFLRPLLNHKSRSSNNISRVRSNSLNQSESSLRQHRDSFLQHNSLVDENSKYFGVPLQQALEEAHAKISIVEDTTGTDQDSAQYGQIPIVVAKCGIFLKKNGLTVEGLFRVGGSSKRLKELQTIFNTPPSFGKNLNWEGYNVHDAASILRRYLNALPEPLIPLDMYETFRNPLRERPRIINYMKYKAENPSKILESTSTITTECPNEILDSSQLLTEANIGRLNSSESKDESIKKPASISSSNNPSSSDLTQSQQPQQQQQQPPKAEEEGDKKPKKRSKNYKKLTQDLHSAIDEYKVLITTLPIASKQLLFYILDLLAMVQNHSDENLMSSRNLAAIFQPSILSHPSHDLDLVEYALSQLVVEFLIQYAYKLLPKQKSKSEEQLTASSSTSPTQETSENSSRPDQDKQEKDQTKGDEEPSEISESKDKKEDTEQSDTNQGNSSVPGFKHNVTSSIPFDSEEDFEVSDEGHDIGSDFDELHFQQLHIDSGTTSMPSPPPPIIISTPTSIS